MQPFIYIRFMHIEYLISDWRLLLYDEFLERNNERQFFASLLRSCKAWKQILALKFVESTYIGSFYTVTIIHLHRRFRTGECRGKESFVNEAKEIVTGKN